jgi:hypothetical protein
MSIFDEVLKMKTADVAEQSIGFAGHLGRSLAAGAGAGVAGAAIAGAGVAASKIYDAMTKVRDFRGMLGSSFNADLTPMYRQRPREFNEAFSSLRSMNPAFSKDPMVAGNYMRRIMVMRPEDAGGALLESLSHRKDVDESPIFDAFSRAGTSVAGGTMGEAMKPQKRDGMKLEESKELERYKAELRRGGGAEGQGGGGQGAPGSRRGRRLPTGPETFGGTPEPGS